eukprot:Clim_evm41s148 gene=Clim_evmTU41s148
MASQTSMLRFLQPKGESGERRKEKGKQSTLVPAGLGASSKRVASQAKMAKMSPKGFSNDDFLDDTVFESIDLAEIDKLAEQKSRASKEVAQQKIQGTNGSVSSKAYNAITNYVSGGKSMALSPFQEKNDDEGANPSIRKGVPRDDTFKRRGWPVFEEDEGYKWYFPRKEGMQERDYQRNIVAKCLFSNTLVCLPTGLGKTFIAAVLMYNFYRWFPEGKLIFMAPTKPLVQQQIRACYEIMRVPQHEMICLTGEVNNKVRREEWMVRRLFFATPQTVYADLADGIAPSKSIVCVVIDEAHKATGNYAYVQVVKTLLSAGARFRVLALSATPGDNLDVVQSVLSNLRISTVEIRDEGSIDVAPYVHGKSHEKIVVSMTKGLEELLKVVNANADRYLKACQASGVQVYQRDVNRLTVGACFMMQKKAPPGTGRSWAYGLYRLLRFREAVTFYGYGTAMSMLLENATKDQKNKRGKAGGNQDEARYMDVLQRLIDSGELHPKLVKLIDILQKFIQDKPESRAIVFTHYRESSGEIVGKLSEINGIQAAEFTGQGTAKGRKGMTQKVQQQLIQRFSSGELNVIVSTSVGEEGIDIGEVDLIINYDHFTSTTKATQRKGRTGRKRKGRVVDLVTPGVEEMTLSKTKKSTSSYAQTLRTTISRCEMAGAAPWGRMVPKHIIPRIEYLDITVEDKMAQFQPYSNRRSVTSRSSKTNLNDSVGSIEDTSVVSAYRKKRKLEDLLDSIINPQRLTETKRLFIMKDPNWGFDAKQALRIHASRFQLTHRSYEGPYMGTSPLTHGYRKILYGLQSGRFKTAELTSLLGTKPDGISSPELLSDLGSRGVALCVDDDVMALDEAGIEEVTTALYDNDPPSPIFKCQEFGPVPSPGRLLEPLLSRDTGPKHRSTSNAKRPHLQSCVPSSAIRAQPVEIMREIIQRAPPPPKTTTSTTTIQSVFTDDSDDDDTSMMMAMMAAADKAEKTVTTATLSKNPIAAPKTSKQLTQKQPEAMPNPSTSPDSETMLRRPTGLTRRAVVSSGGDNASNPFTIDDSDGDSSNSSQAVEDNRLVADGDVPSDTPVVHKRDSRATKLKLIESQASHDDILSSEDEDDDNSDDPNRYVADSFIHDGSETPHSAVTGASLTQQTQSGGPLSVPKPYVQSTSPTDGLPDHLKDAVRRIEQQAEEKKQGRKRKQAVVEKRTRQQKHVALLISSEEDDDDNECILQIAQAHKRQAMNNVRQAHQPPDTVLKGTSGGGFQTAAATMGMDTRTSATAAIHPFPVPPPSVKFIDDSSNEDATKAGEEPVALSPNQSSVAAARYTDLATSVADAPLPVFTGTTQGTPSSQPPRRPDDPVLLVDRMETKYGVSAVMLKRQIPGVRVIVGGKEELNGASFVLSAKTCVLHWKAKSLATAAKREELHLLLVHLKTVFDHIYVLLDNEGGGELCGEGGFGADTLTIHTVESALPSVMRYATVLDCENLDAVADIVIHLFKDILDHEENTLLRAREVVKPDGDPIMQLLLTIPSLSYITACRVREGLSFASMTLADVLSCSDTAQYRKHFPWLPERAMFAMIRHFNSV